jgi:hypothetical protein
MPSYVALINWTDHAPSRSSLPASLAGQTEGEQAEEKGLVDKVKDALTGRDESDRQKKQ